MGYHSARVSFKNTHRLLDIHHTSLVTTLLFKLSAKEAAHLRLVQAHTWRFRLHDLSPAICSDPAGGEVLQGLFKVLLHQSIRVSDEMMSG